MLSTPVAKNLVIPWDLHYDPQGYIWFTEKGGTIWRMKDRTWELDSLHHIDETFVSTIENSGLHSMIFHPQWPDSNFVYFHYTYSESASRLERFAFDEEQSKLTSNLVVFDSILANRSHNGSRMTLDPTGRILISVGDAYSFAPAQDTSTLVGKVLRFNPDGSIPEDNPFGNYTWTYGHRNPQGLVQSDNGLIYSCEHGPTSDDELNIIEKGKNYGWPNVSGFPDLDSEKEFAANHAVTDPIKTWTPTEAPGSVGHYNSDYFPDLKNHLLVSFLKGGRVDALPLDETGRKVGAGIRYFIADLLRIRDVLILPDGRMFMSSSNREYTKPGVYPEDDHIYALTNLQHEQPDDLEVQISCNTTDSTFQVSIGNRGLEGKVFIRESIGYEHGKTTIDSNTGSAIIDWWPAHNDYYYVKVILTDGRIIQQRFTYKKPIE